MNDQKKQAVSRYLKEVSEKLVSFRSTRKFFLKEFQELVTSYAEEHADLTIEDLYKEFGRPEAFANQYPEREDLIALLKKAKKRTVLLTVFIVTAAILILLLIALVAYLIWRFGGTVTVTDSQNLSHIK